MYWCYALFQAAAFWGIEFSGWVYEQIQTRSGKAKNLKLVIAIYVYISENYCQLEHSTV